MLSRVPVPVRPLTPETLSRDDLFRPFEQMFDDLFNQVSGRGLSAAKGHVGYPRLDVYQGIGKFVIEVAIPGVDPADVRVEVEPGKAGANSQDVLHISGKMEAVPPDTVHFVRELSRRAFRRSMLLPANLRGEPEAVIRHGLLTLTWSLPTEPVRPTVRTIQVKTEPT